MAREIIDIFLNLSDPHTKRRLLTSIGSLAGMYDVKVTPRRMTRTGAQNRYYWAVVVKSFTDFLRDQGETVTAEEAHDLLKTKFLTREIVNKDTGEPIGTTLRSTAALDIVEFCAYLDQCIAWLADMFGIICPDADQYRRHGPANQPKGDIY